MLKSLLPKLNQAMPLMMAVFLVIAVIQLIAMFAPSWHPFLAHLTNILAAGHNFYPALAGFFTILVLWGIGHEIYAEHLARKGLLPHRGIVMDVLTRLTNRKELEEMLSRRQRKEALDAEELTASLQARVIGQDQVCEDVASQLRRRLALKNREKPVGVFLFAGAPGTGKTYLAKQISKQTGRPLLHFDMTQMSSPHAATQLFGSPRGYVGSDNFGALTGGLKEHPDAVVLLDEIEKAHPDVFKKFLMAWNDGAVTEASTGENVPSNQAIFILTSNIATQALSKVADELVDQPEKMRAESVEILRKSGFAPEVLNRIDRIFVFRTLKDLDLARVAALEIENMIEGYGLKIEHGGIAPTLLFDVLMRQEKLGSQASVRDLVRSIEEMIAENLIAAKQAGIEQVKLEATKTGFRAVASDVDPSLTGRP